MAALLLLAASGLILPHSSYIYRGFTFSIFGVFFVLGVAPETPTNFTPRTGQFGISYLFWHLAQAGFVGFGKSLHAFPATTISGLELRQILLFFHLMVMFLAWLVDRVFPPADEIFLRASAAPTSLASLVSDGGPALVQGHDAYTCFFGGISVFTNFAALN